MKAAIVERPGELVVRDIPRPEPGDYEALCQLLYGATCTGTDQHIIHDRLPWETPYPCVLGHESVGRVVAVGAKVRNLNVGDVITRVGTPPAADGSFGISWGGFTEFGIAGDFHAMAEDGLSEAEWQGYRVNRIVPPDLDPRAATMIITWRETLSYLTRMGVGEGSAALVLGSGGNGLSFAAHARNLGAGCVAMSGHPAREATAGEVGASVYVDYHADDVAEQLAREHAEGFDFIIDSVGKRGQMDRVLPALKNGGVVGIYGIDEPDAQSIDPRRAPGSFTYYNENYDEAETHDRVIAHMRDGSLDARPWLDLGHAYPLDDIVQAFEALAQRKHVKALIQLT
jgi:threonine dehydrogenase-like Zn-dependent dehydrogenase